MLHQIRCILLAHFRLRVTRLIVIEKVQNYEKIVSYTSKTFLKMADEKMHIPHPTSLDPPLAISYRNHQKISAYFSHLEPLVWHGIMPSFKYTPGHYVRRCPTQNQVKSKKKSPRPQMSDFLPKTK